MNEFEQRVLEDLSALKVQMHQLIGIGQPGRVQALEERVAAHERAMQRVQGFAGAFGSVLAVVQLVFFLLRGRH
jgi:hypothetical protein